MTQNATSAGFMARSWRGQIKLWQAFLIVNLLGFIVAEAIAIGGGMLLLRLTNIKAPGMLWVLLINVSFGVYCAVCLWRSAPNPKQSIKGALTKMWSIIFSLYLAFATYSFILG